MAERSAWRAHQDLRAGVRPHATPALRRGRRRARFTPLTLARLLMLAVLALVALGLWP